MVQYADVNEIRDGDFKALVVFAFLGLHPREVVSRPMRVWIITTFLADPGPRLALFGGASVTTPSPIGTLLSYFIRVRNTIPTAAVLSRPDARLVCRPAPYLIETAVVAAKGCREPNAGCRRPCRGRRSSSFPLPSVPYFALGHQRVRQRPVPCQTLCPRQRV